MSESESKGHCNAALDPMLTANWMELNEQWQQRSKLMFQRSVKEPDLTKAQLTWNTACQSELRRLKWKGSCLGQETQDEILRAFAACYELTANAEL